jgi:hypothetical protein
MKIIVCSVFLVICLFSAPGTAAVPFGSTSCAHSWSMEHFNAGTEDQYSVWSTELSDGSEVEAIDGPMGFIGIVVTEPNMNSVKAFKKPSQSDETLIIGDIYGKHVSFTTTMPWDSIIDDMLCNQEDKSFIDSCYESILKNQGKNDSIDVQVGEEISSIILADDTVSSLLNEWNIDPAIQEELLDVFSYDVNQILDKPETYQFKYQKL